MVDAFSLFWVCYPYLIAGNFETSSISELLAHLMSLIQPAHRPCRTVPAHALYSQQLDTHLRTPGLGVPVGSPLNHLVISFFVGPWDDLMHQAAAPLLWRVHVAEGRESGVKVSVLRPVVEVQGKVQSYLWRPSG